MYFLALAEQYGYESVIQSTYKTIRTWDIIQDAKNTYLCLWQETVFSQLYNTVWLQDFTEWSIYRRALFSPKTMNIIHWMVKQYFSSYKAVVQLYLSTDSMNTIIREPKQSKTTKKTLENQSIKQSCIIYPDLWSMTQHLAKAYKKPIQEIQLSEDIAILHWWLTQVQKAKIFRGIKNATITTLFATNRWLFFDRYNLVDITIYNKNNWAYSSQSEPRFVLEEVSEMIATIYECNITYKTL